MNLIVNLRTEGDPWKITGQSLDKSRKIEGEKGVKKGCNLTYIH